MRLLEITFNEDWRIEEYFCSLFILIAQKRNIFFCVLLVAHFSKPFSGWVPSSSISYLDNKCLYLLIWRAFSPLLWEKCFAATSQASYKTQENFFKVRHVCQSIFGIWRKIGKLDLLCQSSLDSLLNLKLTWIIPGLVTSPLVCCPGSTGGVRGLEELFLTPARSWPGAPAWPPPPPPAPASLPSGLESPENWKEKIFALKSLQKLCKFKKRRDYKFKIFKSNFFEVKCNFESSSTN